MNCQRDTSSHYVHIFSISYVGLVVIRKCPQVGDDVGGGCDDDEYVDVCDHYYKYDRQGIMRIQRKPNDTSPGT